MLRLGACPSLGHERCRARRKFRQRLHDLSLCLQAKAETLEAQLAATTAQVQQLEASQRLLEARNALLESVASTTLGSDQEAPAVSQLHCTSVAHTKLLELHAHDAHCKMLTTLCRDCGRYAQHIVRSDFSVLTQVSPCWHKHQGLSHHAMCGPQMLSKQQF